MSKARKTSDFNDVSTEVCKIDFGQKPRAFLQFKNFISIEI